MMELNTIEELFHFSTENKDNDADKMEKNNRRIETICRKSTEVRHAIYESRKGVIDSIQIVNERYALILDDEDIKSAIYELNAFSKILSNTHIDMTTKACVINSFDLKAYKKLLSTCKFTGLKSISRLDNMRTMTNKYIHGRFNKKEYSEDIKEQAIFFNDLISKYVDISVENFYVYVLRYDLKTIRKRNPIIRKRLI
jgi:hypothetical protein